MGEFKQDPVTGRIISGDPAQLRRRLCAKDGCRAPALRDRPTCQWHTPYYRRVRRHTPYREAKRAIWEARKALARDPIVRNYIGPKINDVRFSGDELLLRALTVAVSTIRDYNDLQARIHYLLGLRLYHLSGVTGHGDLVPGDRRSHPKEEPGSGTD